MQEKRIKNEKLKTIKKNWKGNLIVDNCFVELCDSRKNNWHGIKVMFKALVLPIFHRKKKFIQAESTNDFTFDKKNDFIVWLGHSSFFIRINGVSIIIDPSFHNLPFIKRAVQLPFSISKLGQIDYILISHLHSDHVTEKSLEEIISFSPNAKILSGLGMNKCLKKYADRMQVAGWYQQYDTQKELDIFYLPAMHNSGSNLFNMNKSLWGSFVIKTAEKIIFCSGDTGYTKHFEEIKKLFPKIDCALIELSWIEKTFVDGKLINGHLYPDQIKDVLKTLKPELVMPMHYGTFYRSLKTDPIEKFKESLKKLGFENKAKIPAIGERVKL